MGGGATERRRHLIQMEVRAKAGYSQDGRRENVNIGVGFCSLTCKRSFPRTLTALGMSDSFHAEASRGIRLRRCGRFRELKGQKIEDRRYWTSASSAR